MCVSQILNPKTCLHKILQEEYIILLAEQEAEVSVTLKELGERKVICDGRDLALIILFMLDTYITYLVLVAQLFQQVL